MYKIQKRLNIKSFTPALTLLRRSGYAKEKGRKFILVAQGSPAEPDSVLRSSRGRGERRTGDREEIGGSSSTKSKSMKVT
jgi:hypothetical protein